MSAIDELATRVAARLDRFTNKLADEIRALIGNDTETITKLEPVITKLESLGADPNNPIPDHPTAKPAE